MYPARGCIVANNVGTFVHVVLPILLVYDSLRRFCPNTYTQHKDRN